ncbi:D-2-hydroxyacid dehydrogenase [Paenibacillus silviterrae]|uniref:D-2-hydroxyacid dehydrogenase n=1 Tax=Paenibacillus silviterrae TaxID=3242194 RepID=UPI002542842F|nr:D-2-hydroxyacid dehydrogenase [Paenibacillus chinjuensis]
MNIQHILVTGRLYSEFQRLQQEFPNKQFRCIPENEVTDEDYTWAEAYVAFRPTAGFHMRNIRWVHSMGAGVDAYLNHAEWKPGIPLTRTIGSMGRMIGEYCLSHILSELQHHSLFMDQQAGRQWVPKAPRHLKDQHVLIFGTGTIGQGIAQTLSPLGVKVTGVSRGGSLKPFFTRVAPLAELDDLLPHVNWIINAMPLTLETERFFNASFFRRWKSNYADQRYFINVGRGRSVVEEELLLALKQGWLHKAILDVCEQEPLPGESALWPHPGVILTPHISAITDPQEAVVEFIRTLQAVEQGRVAELPNLVQIDRGY